MRTIELSYDSASELFECKIPSCSTTHLLRQNIFTITTALGFLSCLQCWMPASTVVSFNDLLATGEFKY